MDQEQQVQRGVHVAEAHGQVAGPDHLRTHLRIGEGLCVEHDVLVVGAGRTGHVVHEGCVGGAAQCVGDSFPPMSTPTANQL
jgi:hypothetical protein